MLIGIPVYEGVDLLDVTGPYEMFTWAKLDVRLFAETPGLVTCNGGLEIQARCSFAEAPAFDVLWTPGGNPPALQRILAEPKHTYLDFLRRQAAGARYVASVCEGALLLAAAGLLDGYSVTTHWAFIPCLLAQYPAIKVVDGHPRFHLDRNRLTGGGISSGLDEALELIRLLLGRETAESVQQTTQYYPDPPVHSEIPQTITCPLDEITATARP